MLISVSRKNEKNITSPYWVWRNGYEVDVAITGDSYIRFHIEWAENSPTGTITLTTSGYNSNDSLKIVECRLISEYDLYSINAPTYTTEFEYEESGENYYSIHATNRNSTSGTLYYKTSSASTYTSVSVGAYATANIGTYENGTSGTMYLVINGEYSEEVSWAS